jgi:hypothetical protein
MNVGMAVLSAVSEAVRHFIDLRPATPALFGYLVATAVPIALLHEVGHTLLAAARTGTRGRISIGATRHLVRAQLRRLTLTASLLTPPDSSGESASFDEARASARELILIALGGPIASLAGFGMAACGLALSARHGVLHDSLWAATVAGFIATLSAVPLESGERRSRPPIRTDGRVVLDAARAARSLNSATVVATAPATTAGGGQPLRGSAHATQSAQHT